MQPATQSKLHDYITVFGLSKLLFFQKMGAKKGSVLAGAIFITKKASFYLFLFKVHDEKEKIQYCIIVFG
jgi:activator of 2-hydroxyglutaryl-CoA dehydratase